MLAAVLPVQPQVESDNSASRLVASLSAGLGVLMVAALASWLAYNAPGLRADLIIINATSRRIEATICAGRVTHLTGAFAARMVGQ